MSRPSRTITDLLMDFEDFLRENGMPRSYVPPYTIIALDLIRSDGLGKLPFPRTAVPYQDRNPPVASLPPDFRPIPGSNPQGSCRPTIWAGNSSFSDHA